MTNSQIIINEAVANGLYTLEEVERILASGHMIPVHTFQTWKNAGYIVKRGEHARITTRLWKFTSKAKKNEETDENTDGAENNHYYLAKAFLFTADQVEKNKQITVLPGSWPRLYPKKVRYTYYGF